MPDAAPTPDPPLLRLGVTADDGIAASIYAVLDRGISLRPHLARQMRGEVELRFAEDLAPVRMLFDDETIFVEDGAAQDPDLTVSGRLPHVVALTTAPLLGGWPNPMVRRGRAALARVADGSVAIRGNRALARRLLRLMAL